MDIITRAEWGARAPRSRETTSWARRTECVVHYSEGPTTQSVRSIQDFHMDGRGWSDIGYNFLVDVDGRIYEGRGWLTVGAHAPDHNTSGIGVCMIGRDGDATPAAKRSIRWVYDEACRRSGRTLRKLGHRDVYATSCLPLDSTEVLTRRGWTPLGEVQPNDEVASWAMDSGAVTFDRPAGIIPPYQDDTVIIDGFETTPDHNWVTYGQRAWAVACSCGYVGSPAGIRAHGREGRRRGETHETVFEKRWKLVRADQMGRGFRYPGAVDSGGPGLPLTDDQIRLMVWLQGDGHLMREHRGRSPDPYGVEWHLRKPRKVERLAGLLHALGIEHCRNEKADGTVSVRVYGDAARDRVIALLPDKRFHWGLLDLLPTQATVFLDELLHVDGCRTGSYFSSVEDINLDVVQAVAVLNGVAATRGQDPHKVMLRAGTRRSRWLREMGACETGRATTVGCLTTVNGTLIVRQHGRTVVLGNCPGDELWAWVHAGMPVDGIVIEEDDMPDYISVGMDAEQALPPNTWVTVTWGKEYSDQEHNHWDEGGSSFVVGPARYAFTANVRIDGLPPGTELQARAIEHPEGKGDVANGPISEHLASEGATFVHHSIAADTVGDGFRVRFQVIHYGTETATIVGGSAKAFAWPT